MISLLVRFYIALDFQSAFESKGDDARIYVKENLDVGNVYHFSLGLPRNFYSYFIHDLFVF